MLDTGRSGKGNMGRFQYPFESHYTTIAGVRIHYVDEGIGDPVLMVHGQPTWSYLYRNIIPYIALDHRTIAMDLMGFGLSDKPTNREYSFEEHTDILEGFIRELGLHNFTLVLHDWGGPIGLHYAVGHSANIKGIVLLNTLATVDFKLPWAFRLLFRSPILSDFLVRRMNLMAFLAFRFGFRDRSRTPRQVLANYREPHPNYASRKGVARFPRLIPAGPRDSAYPSIKAIAEALPGLDVPTLFLFGEHDPVTARINPTPVVEAMPKARLEIVPGAGHFLQEDQPEEVTRRIRAFLGEAEEDTS